MDELSRLLKDKTGKQTFEDHDSTGKKFDTQFPGAGNFWALRKSYISGRADHQIKKCSTKQPRYQTKYR